MMGKTAVTVRIDDEALKAVDHFAGSHDMSRSEVIRNSLDPLGPAPQGGAWVVGYYQEPPAAIFATEIEALRFHAEGRGQFVKFVPWGEWS